MNKRSMYVIALAVLLLGVATVTSGVWLAGSFSHGEPSFDQGCYCHNNGIAVWVNDSGDGNGGLFFGPIAAGSTFHLLISTNNAQATGVVPGLQEWESNQTSNAKFTISPTEVTSSSSQNLNKTSGSITALYKITAPSTAGTYTLTLYGQGTLLQPISIQVTGGSTTSTTSTTTSTTSTPTSSTTQSSSTSTTSTTTKSSTSSSMTSTSTSASSTFTTSTSATTTTAVGITFTSPALGTSLVGQQAYTISGTIYPIPALPDNVSIEVQLLGSSTVLDSSIQPVTPSGNFSYTTHVGGSHPWTSGPYLITATDSYGLKATTTFEFETSVTTTTTTSTTPTVTTTQTATQTVTGPTTTMTTTLPVTTTRTSTTIQTVTGPTTIVTGPTSTITSTAPPTTLTTTITTTQTATSTVTQTTSATPDWTYGAMVVLLLIGLAIGYVVKRPSVK